MERVGDRPGQKKFPEVFNMGKMKNFTNLTFTSLQKFIFEQFANSKLNKRFYFTGGTALSAIFLHHRESEDLDFFSEENFDSEDREDIEQFIAEIAKNKQLKVHFTPRERTRIYEFLKDRKVQIKVDFADYPYKRLKKGIKVNNVEVDSMRDIATNKLHTITARTEVKDFVDLYFLLKKFTLWDLIYGVREKFRIELDLFWLGSDFLKVDKFDYLPKMLVPLKLKTLQDFFRKKAKEIGMRVVKK